MAPTTNVDLHCHSTFSDGQLQVEELVDRLSAAGVAFAALTDHDTIEGLPRFGREAARRGIGCLSGLELTVRCDGREAHLLAYGFDPTAPRLLATLESLRHSRSRRLQHHAPMHSIERALSAVAAAPDDAPDGTPDIAEAISLVHGAGGKAFLAHPLLFEGDVPKLRDLLGRLQRQGLDGIEAIYAGFSQEDRRRLCELAEELGLLISAGCDLHASSAAGGFGIPMPLPQWRQFRNAALAGARSSPSSHRAAPAGGPRLRQFALHIILPTLLAMALFVTAIFAVFLPAMGRALLDRKREMIRELTNSAWGILAEAQRQEQAGVLTREQAQDLAKARIAAMRYGREGKDYFWLQDVQPRMIMHPYRGDLDGRDVTDFRDARGTRIFVEFADLVRRKKEGYVEYVWQWKDDPARLAPKESYIRGFEPWGWIIGTGIYIEDVNAEIARIERGLLYGSVGISVIVAMLLFYVMRESLRLERKRSAAQRHLEESSERYRSLVDAATEGTLLVQEGRCRYANPMMLEMLGYTAAEMELMDLEDILGGREENAAAWRALDQLGEASVPGDDVAAQLRRRDRSVLECRVTLRPIDLTGRSGLILMARPATAQHREQQRRAMIDRLLLPDGAATDLAREVAQADGPEGVIAASRRTDGLVRSLLACGANPRHITHLLSSVCDAATRRLVDLATAQLGPPPVAFAFIAMGSQGRQEQTLYTDQDNAILYADAGPAAPAAVEAYFRALGQRVCDQLAQAGYGHCRGNIMAANERWRQPLSVWQRYFSEWICKAEPRELLDFSIFFDFRAVCGQADLVEGLRRHVVAVATGAAAFFPHFASHALLFKPPLGLFGRIMTGGAGSDSHGMLDLKAAMMPIVSFARLYALRHGVVQTGTLDRLAALAHQGVLLDSTHQEMQAAYESLMRLRLRHQCDALQEGRAPDNLIAPASLGHIERAILKESFAEIEAVQQKVRYDFLGGTSP